MYTKLKALVAVSAASISFDKAFSYLIPESLAEKAVPGVRVLIPFGKGNRKRVGLILRVEKLEEHEKKLKPIISAADNFPVLNDEMLDMVDWLRENTFCTYFDAVRTILPSGMNINIKENYTLNQNCIDISLTDKENKVLDFLRENIDTNNAAEEVKAQGNGLILESLISKGILQYELTGKQNVGDSSIKMLELTESYKKSPESFKLTVKQKMLADILTDHDEISVKEACYLCGVGTSVEKKLVEKGLFAKHSFRDIKHRSKAMEDCIQHAKAAAATEYTVLITGESGTGKELIAQAIHNDSQRKNRPFVGVNCAAIPENLLESELFGYVGGAFTGADKNGKIGYFEMAKGGTLFLDEISELPLLLQGKLLEVLQDGTFYRVGGVKKISTDVRLIVATNRNLEQMVKEGKFREDLYYRISVFPIKLPPLRDRIADLYSIIEDTLPLIYSRLEVEPMILTDDALQKMKQYRWPGNIRELENVLEKAAVISEGNFIHAEDIKLDNSIAGSPIAKSLKEKMKLYEKELIQTAFEQFSGNRRLVAEYLGISKTNLFEKVHQYGIDEKPEERNV